MMETQYGLQSRRHFLAHAGIGAAALAASAAFAPTAFAAEPPAGGVKATRLAGNPVLRPGMMPGDDGQWSGNLNFPSLIRVPGWVEKPLGKYYLYFSAHHGSYIRLAYSDDAEGPWKIHRAGTLRLEQVEAANGAERTPQRHVASPDVHVDDERKQIRMYFHYFLPELGHKGSVALSPDGLRFEPRAGAISGPYLRVFRRDGAYFAIDDTGTLVRSPDGIEAFRAVSDAVRIVADDPAKRSQFRHGGVSLSGDVLSVFFTRIGDAPERILFTQVRTAGEPATWKAAPPTDVLEPEKDYEGIAAELMPSTFMGQTNVRQLRDPFVFHEGDRKYLLYAVAGETGIAMARLEM